MNITNAYTNSATPILSAAVSANYEELVLKQLNCNLLYSSFLKYHFKFSIIFIIPLIKFICKSAFWSGWINVLVKENISKSAFSIKLNFLIL